MDVDKDAFTIYMSSADLCYDKNIPSNFHYALPRPLRLEGEYTVTLLHFHEARGTGLSSGPRRRDDKDTNFVYVCCDVCEYSLLSDIWMPILEFFPVFKPAKHARYFSYPNDIVAGSNQRPVKMRPLPNNELRYLHIWLLDGKGENFPDVNGPARCALRFEKLPGKNAFSKFVPTSGSL